MVYRNKKLNVPVEISKIGNYPVHAAFLIIIIIKITIKRMHVFPCGIP